MSENQGTARVYYLEETLRDAGREASLEEILAEFRYGGLEADRSIYYTVDGQAKRSTVKQLCAGHEAVPANTAKPNGTVPPVMAKLNEARYPQAPISFKAAGRIQILRGAAAGSSEFHPVADFGRGLVHGHIDLDADGILLGKSLSFVFGLLLFLVSLLVFTFVLIVLFSVAGSHQPPAMESLIPLILAIGVPVLVSWRVRQFRLRFSSAEIGEATVSLVSVEILLKPPAGAGGLQLVPGGLPHPGPAKLIFFPNNNLALDAITRSLKSRDAVIHEHGAMQKAEFQQRLTVATPSAWVTPVLLGLNILVFLLMGLANPEALATPSLQTLLKWGANYGPLTLTGLQWWRMFTCCFVHIGLLHILFNMLALWQVGRLVERLLGSGFYLIIYLGCGLVGSLASLLFHPNIVSAGASGAIFGVYGALMGYLMRQGGGLPKGILSNFVKFGLTFLLYNIISSLNSIVQEASRAQGAHIDFAAHAGGLISGVIFGFLAARPLETDQRRLMARGKLLALAGAIVVMAGAMLFLAYHRFHGP